jgi:hypothetical protein
MKIRKGYVSNSSSSSFIIDESHYDSIFDVAEDMINERKWGEQDKKDIKKLRKLKIDSNTPISFCTCNYDTYIMRKYGCYLITTCNNHDFDDIFYGKSANNEKYKKIKEEFQIEDLFEIKEKTYFYRLESGIIGKPDKYEHPERFYCHDRSWTVKNFPNIHICPICKLDKNKTLHSYNQTRRKEKIKRVLQ